MQTLFITGPRGLLGSTLLHTLPLAGYTVHTYEGDIRDKQAVLAAVAAAKPEWVIHTAAKTNVAECERDPALAYAVNAEGTAHVIEAARAVDARVLYISTASVFAGITGNYREEDTPEPNNVHNKSKVLGEQAVLAYDNGLVVRLNIVGIHPDGSRGQNFMEWLVDSFAANKDITLFDDVYINPLSNWTIAEYVLELMQKTTGQKIVHIGSKDVVSKAAIGEMVAKQFPTYTGHIAHGSVDAIADGVTRPKQMWLNCDLVQKEYGVVLPTVVEEIEKIFAKVAQ